MPCSSREYKWAKVNEHVQSALHTMVSVQKCELTPASVEARGEQCMRVPIMSASIHKPCPSQHSNLALCHTEGGLLGVEMVAAYLNHSLLWFLRKALDHATVIIHGTFLSRAQLHLVSCSVWNDSNANCVASKNQLTSKPAKVSQGSPREPRFA